MNENRSRCSPLAVAVAGAVIIFLWSGHVGGESLTPPYFNLAEGKNITASATCGEDIEGPELYCKLVGANAENEYDENVIIQGQYCDVCDPTRPDKMHPPEFAVDGMETWWQSPPLSRGMRYNSVNLTIDLGQEFHVAYVYIRMGNSPRPGLWVLEKSADYGKTYTPWQYFSDSEVDCEKYFGAESLEHISRDDSVVCNTEYSKILPLEGGEIPISLLNGRPSADHYFNSSVLQEWTRATNVRLRLLRTKNLLGHLMSFEREDPTVTRRYFYSIKDISIGGRCMCNGHADTCDTQNFSDPSILWCRCQHNTGGPKCERCSPGFEQKKWRISKHDAPFICEPCNCFLHTTECKYDPEVDAQGLSLDIHGRYEGGGVCQNCQHNTEGINCNKCKPKFYRPYQKSWNETDVCKPCDCDHFFSTGNCAEGSGRCECRKEYNPPNCDTCSYGYYSYPDCKACDCFLNGTRHAQCEAHGDCPCYPNFGGRLCRECAVGYWEFPTCQRCECNADGSVNEACDQTTGNCTCKNGFAGKHCDQCADGYYNYPYCTYCQCDLKGTMEGICNKASGECLCKEGYGGSRCDVCISGYYGYPDCQPCNCSKTGSVGKACGIDGKCQCSFNYAGKTCEQCSPGYYQYPECLSCNCNTHGSNGLSCDNDGNCNCKYNYFGKLCDSCREGFYNFPLCEDCNCNPAGVVASFAGCGSVPAGELCICKERVEGRICNKCRPLYWNLNPRNHEGCEECACNPAGTLGSIGVCDTETGQCACKPAVTARGCEECADGTWGLTEENLFGCNDCDCDVGGSTSSTCNKVNGNCTCQEFVEGRTCRQPLKAYYFPTLYQYQYEVEDGRTPDFTRVRIGYDEQLFPNFSWKGYARFSRLQREIIQEIFIKKPSLYRMVVRFVNTNPDTVIGTIRTVPENPSDYDQMVKVQFRTTSTPEFVTVSGATGNTPQPFVLSPGSWTVHIQVPQDLMIDYFVLLPEDYYLATILNQEVEKPCKINDRSLCREYTYPNLTYYTFMWGAEGSRYENGNFNEIQDYFQDNEHLNQLNIANRVPLLNSQQPELVFNIKVIQAGWYVIIINYITPLENQRLNRVQVEISADSTSYNGNAILYGCPYKTMCRQVVIDGNKRVGEFQIKGENLQVILKGYDSQVGIHSILALPYEEWSLDYIKLKPVCIHKDGTCVQSIFRKPPESKRMQFEQELSGEEGKNATNIIIAKINNASYVEVSPNQKNVILRGKVSQPGYYTFIVHYYQPEFPGFPLNVTISNDQVFTASLSIQHCPAISGCRALVLQANKNERFYIDGSYLITVTVLPESKNVYLDYLLVVPSELYRSRYLEEEKFDRTGEFISTCGANHFDVDAVNNGFCRESVFSITAGHNNGALRCDCDYEGSLSFECDAFGGQCPCKPNIIGRQCDACRTGYYNFPECLPCRCPINSVCEENTGQCICPPKVVGKQCDQCEPYTYGYDSLIGCSDCKCNVLGVENGNLQCDLLTGDCSCKSNIVGRQCEKCQAGYYYYPLCQSCECNTRGTTSEICDPGTAACLCKKNVDGYGCNQCREGTFNLQASNELGCTECFCFGKATRCGSAMLVKSYLQQLDGWTVTGVNFTSKGRIIEYPTNLTVEHVDERSIGVAFGYGNLTDRTVYLTAPEAYIGKKLNSYGLHFNYSIFYTVANQGSAAGGPDLILQGNNTYLTFTSLEQPPPSQEFHWSVQLVESNFELPNGEQANRENIMEVLNDLKGIYIRVNYWTFGVTTKVQDMVLEEAVAPSQSSSVSRAFTIEQCQCPANYKGLSCEECSPGYYRISSGSHGGYCVPCQCHGHATECDVHTGECLNCTHNTVGKHCEQCEAGYHGNALAGTPKDCLICACPQPYTSNNFATSCDVSSDGEKIRCECKEGYLGARCQSCASGFYGQPEVLGDYCKPCQCSGNINASDPRACDTVSGECRHCLNNTGGVACSLCAPGFYGDAVLKKDCQACNCDFQGLDHCDSSTGLCVCRKGVIGEKCDRCAPDHYGFQSGQGCVPCLCGTASNSSQCDDLTGECACKTGVGGRACDQCRAGYWNYTAEGCISCGCKSEYSLGFGCNPYTGQCECLQGVIGEKCDHCPHRWSFVQEYGCHPCDHCVHSLLNDTDDLSAIISPIIVEFDSAQSGYFTRRKLDSMRELLNMLEPKFNQLDPRQITLSPFLRELEDLEQSSKLLNRRSNYSLEDSQAAKKEADNLKIRADDLLEQLWIAADESEKALEDINRISFQLTEEEGVETEQALKQAEQLLGTIKSYNFTEPSLKADKQLEVSKKRLEEAHQFKLPVDDIFKQSAEIKADLKKFSHNLEDLFNHTQYSVNKVQEVDNIIARSNKDRLKKKLEDIANFTDISKRNINESIDINDNTTAILEHVRANLRTLKTIPFDLEKKLTDFNSTLVADAIAYEQVYNLLDKVDVHANNLTRRANELDNFLAETRDISENALKAANAYENIVEAVRDAKSASGVAENATMVSIGVLEEVENGTFNASQSTSKLLDDAYELRHSTTENLLPRLEKAKSNYQPVAKSYQDNDNTLKQLEQILKHLQSQSLDYAYRNASQLAKESVDNSREIARGVNDTFKILEEEKTLAKSLPKEMDEAIRNVQQIEKQIKTVNDKIPGILHSLHDLPEQLTVRGQRAAEIDTNIEKLRQQIALARDVANRIKVGVKFYPNTTLELRVPENTQDLSTSTHFSGYFRTQRPSGLIWYLGNPVGTNLRKTNSDDYMALVIQNGFPVLNLDIGNGPEKVIVKKYVADNQWYQYIVDRVGHNVKLSIREELPGGKENIISNQETLKGHLTIFNLDKDRSKFFVGTAPTNLELQPEIDTFTFEGEMEDLVVGDKPVSLWNFVDGEENNHGAKERNRLVNLIPSTGFRFNGNGYAVVDARSFTIRSKSLIQLSFKSFATEGLIFLSGKGKTFIALELRNGKVLYQFNLGADTKKWATSGRYNDGHWHKITARREGQRGSLNVDDENVSDNNATVYGGSTEKQLLEAVDTFSFGGYPNLHNWMDVTNIKFDGCIDNVTIKSQTIDLRQNIKAYDVQPGCPVKHSRTVSFQSDRPGYLASSGLMVSDNFKVSLKFRTEAPNGLLFYATNADQSSGISLSLHKGRLHLISQHIVLNSRELLNDSEWHMVSVEHDSQNLRLDIDDYIFEMLDSPPSPLHILHGTLYIGGLPRRIVPNSDSVASGESFSGCIEDLTINGNVIDFANMTEKYSEVLGKCILDYMVVDPITGVHKVVLPHIDGLQPLTNKPPQMTTIRNGDDESTRRGDGGIDFVPTPRPRPVPTEPTIVRPPVKQPPQRPAQSQNTTLRPLIRATTPSNVGPQQPMRPVGTVPPSTPRPPPKDGCALPVEPEADNDNYQDVYKFGAHSYSRLEFPTPRGKYHDGFDFSLEFKSEDKDGILFFATSDQEMHFVAIYLLEGYVVYFLKGAEGTVNLTSKTQLNDGKWHSIEFSRNLNISKLVIDSILQDDRILPYNLTVNINRPFYVGGLYKELIEDLSVNNLLEVSQYKGCIRNVYMNSRPLENPSIFDTVPCSDNIESGTFFGVGEKNYIKLKEHFMVGTDFKVQLDIKPRTTSGVLIAVHGKKDFLVLEMLNGTLRLSVNNGKSPINTSYIPEKPYYLCNGKWHNILAVKSRNVVTLRVDNVFSDPTIGNYHFVRTDTGSNLHLGGHRFLNKVKGIESRKAFKGCIKNVVINDENIVLVPSMAVGNVVIGSCPKN